MAYVSLSKLPTPNKEYAIDFPRLDGGLNNWELDYRLGANESPEMKNLWWMDGALCCRDGQVYLTNWAPAGAGLSAYDRLFWGHGFFHIGTALYYADLSAGADAVTPTQLLTGVPANPGSWFSYGGDLYYKNKGGYYRIQYTPDDASLFSAGSVEAYDPIIQINTEPTTGAGDAYQPENRLSAKKTVWYSTVAGVTEYHLPVQDVGSVDAVIVDDVAVTDYTVDLASGVVKFGTEPTHHDPVRVNTVKITFTKVNKDAYDSVMDCKYAAVYGGEQNICIVLGGCDAQPNAYFWCGNNVAMDPGYFPMSQYNFAGATEEAITGFGVQQAMLVIFKEHSVGRAKMGTQEMGSGRVLLTMDYTNINTRHGCDLPDSIRLVANNLVFANTEQGVHIVLDSSAAYENNIMPISRKVDNTLLPLVRKAKSVVGFDDGDRYWLVSDGEVYAWDYTLSAYSDPSWFYFTGINGIAFLRSNTSKFHLNASGQLTEFRRTFADYDGAIEKVYRFSSQNMGSYDALKDVNSVIFVVRGDADSRIRIAYLTDYETREDLYPILSLTWRFGPRNLAYRFMGIRRFATVARRRPGCRHVRHFSMRLWNNEVRMDMGIISAQVFYCFQGRER